MSSQTNPNSTNPNNPEVDWQILAVLIPLAGLIMYFNNNKNYPIKANRYLLLAGIGFGVGIVFRLLGNL